MLKLFPVFILLVFTLPAHRLEAQAVKIRCTEVLPDGDVMVHWNPMIIGTGFYNYTLYRSSDIAGPYNDSVIITSIPQTTYLFTGINADVAPSYFYMRTRKDSGFSPPSDTLASMLLAGSTLDYENIDLSWNPIHSPFLPDMHPWYVLYREFPTGNWSAVDSAQSLQISHHFWSCNPDDDTVRFRIAVRDLFTGCTSLSSRVGYVLKNQSNRYPPTLDSVSINPAGHAILGWQPALEPDIVGYKIFSVTTGNDSIGYVDGRFATSFEHVISEPCNGPLSYIILSVDSCGNESPFPYDPGTLLDKPQSTIYLQSIDYDPCSMSNELSWNEYINFEPGLGYTNVFVSENGGPFQELSVVFPGTTSFRHEGLQPNTTYRYFVRSYSLDPVKTSTSCVQDITTYNSPSPLFMYTRFVTVEDNERVNLIFYTDTNAHVQYYRVLRSDTPVGPFTEAGTVPDDGNEFVSFTDGTAQVNAQSYFYSIEVVDSCGVASIIANLSRTIYLTVDALPDLSNRLQWNAYESWDGGVAGYLVYRRLDDGPLEILASLDAGTLTYTDNVSGLTASISKITYMVEAYEGSTNSFGFQERSISNEVLSEQEPRVYLPNAFAPTGINTTFKPVLVFVGESGYEFLVYNRWGQLIFSAQNPGEGWDGRFDGKYVPQDVYVYLVNFRNALGQPRQIKGNVLVLF